MPETKVKEYKQFKQIVNTIYNEELQILDDKSSIDKKEYGQISIEPIIYFDKFTSNMKVEFAIGKKKKYIIKDLANFYNCMMNKETYKYADKLNIVHRREMFDENSKKIVDFIMKYAETIKIANESAHNNVKYHGNLLDCSRINISHSSLDDLFEILNGQKVILHTDGKQETLEFIDENPNIEFILTKKKYLSNRNKRKMQTFLSAFGDRLLDEDTEDELIKEYNQNNMQNGQIIQEIEEKKEDDDNFVLTPNIEIFKIRILKGKYYKYVLKRNRIYRCSKEFEKTNLMLLELFRNNYISEVELGQEELKDLFSIVIPKVKDAIKIENITKDEIEPYIPKELVTKVYLDFDSKNYLTVDIRFCYGEEEFNPLDETKKVNIPRNAIKETKHLNVFKKLGFLFDGRNLRFVQNDENKIYKFLNSDIKLFTRKFDVTVSEKFKNMEIITPTIGYINVDIKDDKLYISLKDLNIDLENIREILNSYEYGKKFYRLPNGRFIELQNNTQIAFLEKLVTGMEIKLSEIKSANMVVPVYRALYLNELLKSLNNTQIIKNQDYKNLIKNFEEDNLEDEFNVPKDFEEVLRYYQKTGYKWLKTIDEYRFGGILADDMGLGKTIQMIAVIADYIENIETDQRKTSLVICPSSLTLNWQGEFNKFASKLDVHVIRGTIEERKKQIENLNKHDVIITSYDLLKRDIELYKKKNYSFRYIIADEAQYLKNSNTQNAKAIKEIKGQTRFALTGTPMENALSELWSIFDFIMPGYLFEYKRFKAIYESPIVKDEELKAMAKLKLLIKPFILRRTKKEVLTELPDKTITILKNEMYETQEDLYYSYLAQAKEEIAQLVDNDGVKKSQMKILAALTRLRQICCHPQLFIKDYDQSSAKLDQCIEIIEDATASGHKILLFSSYTSMFEIIEKKLITKDIKYYKLTGATKVDERIELVDDFNENKDVKVFLISLKAGGTGLNLTGADTIIHYDPWWNLSAENQATDRAYRIGQKNSVQVYKLITKNTIEEKIYDLQQKKAQLIDNMLDNENILMNKLSKEDIMNLFS